jgi:hydrogenase maturation protein HypF
LARARAAAEHLPLIEVGHHHAHIAACLAENGRALDAPPVFGIALDGIGWGADDTAWGGEFLFADYRNCERLAALKPVAMPGGDRAAREPWRNLYAQLVANVGWDAFRAQCGALDLYRALEAKPRATIDAMVRGNFNAPLGSSCGRLFDAVAAALGLCFDRQGHEAEAASRLEALVCESTLRDEADARAYPFATASLASGLPIIDPTPMWQALLTDLLEKTPVSIIAARFHKGLAIAVAVMAKRLAGSHRFDTVALSGGCFQNAVLHQEIATRLAADEFAVLSHAQVPANDGGIALGQAAVAAARFMAGQE